MRREIRYLRMIRIRRMISILASLRNGRRIDVVAPLSVAGVHVLGWRATSLLNFSCEIGYEHTHAQHQRLAKWHNTQEGEEW